jgi:hypothetical protein
MNFEELIQRRERYDDLRAEHKTELSIVESHPLSTRQKANKGASLYDFIKMLDKLLELTMPQVKFIPDEGKVLTNDAMTQFNCPVITYQVLKRKCKKEIKPRLREMVTELTEDKTSQRTGEIWGQKFECLVQFNVFASVYSEAEQVMEQFEETIIKHTGFFKKNGVAELFFEEHITDSHFDTLRESLSIRSLIYYVEIEKLTVMFKEKINEIELLAQKRKDEEEI